MVDVPLLRLDPDLPRPAPVRSGDAAADLAASQSIEIAAGGRALVPTGFAIAIPDGHCGLVLPRSGLAINDGLTVLNSPGLIDAGYRGEIKVVLHNTTGATVTVERGQRIAQLLVLPVPPAVLVEVDVLPESVDGRGAAGFGSSG